MISKDLEGLRVGKEPTLTVMILLTTMITHCDDPTYSHDYSL